MPQLLLEHVSMTNDSIDLPNEEEILETFQRLGLAGGGPMGYSYFTMTGEKSRHIFEVVRTSNSDSLA